LITPIEGHLSHDPTGDRQLKLRTRVAAYGVAGLALAVALIISGSSLGLLNVGSSGILSVLLTDPPTIPEGVSAVYVTYSSVAVHASGFNNSGWVAFSGEGTIDTLKLVNLSQTISSETVPSLTYNLVQFNISNVTVTYRGANYTAAIAPGRLVVPIVGGVRVSSTNPAAALVDIQPTVLNLGNQTDPDFTITTGAKALQVPLDEVSDSMRNIGNNYPLQGHDWFQAFKTHHSDSLNITGFALTANSFSFSAANVGSDPITIRMVILTPVAQGEEPGTFVSPMTDSIFFTVRSDGSLGLVNGPLGQVETSLGLGGYTLVGGAVHSFSFSGTVTNVFGKHGVYSGLRYSVMLMGSETLSGRTVVAS
jgi:hypothetical protein